MNYATIDGNNFVQLNMFYHLYIGIDRLELENAIIRHMILSNKIFKDVNYEIHKDLYEKLIKKRKRVADEDKGIREN